MINLTSFRDTVAPTDLAVAQTALASVVWSYNDTKFIGVAVARPNTVPAPESGVALEVMRTTLPPGRLAYLLTGNMTISEGVTAPCLVLVGNIGTLTETVAANLDRLARVLGYVATVDGVETPLWVGSEGTHLADAGVDSLLTIKRFDISGSFVTSGGAYSVYVPLDGFAIAQNRTFVQATYSQQAYVVADNICIWHYAGGTNVYLSEKQYITDMQNIQDLANYVVNAMGNPAETTELTARVAAIETTMANDVPAPVTAAIGTSVAAEATARETAVAALAVAVSQLPVFGAKISQVADAAATVNQYIPRP